MAYQELVIEIGGYRQTHQIPQDEPMIIKTWLQSDSGKEASPMTRIHIVCPGDGDIVMTARPNGHIGIEPTED